MSGLRLDVCGTSQTVHCGEALEVLRGLPAGSVHAVVTDPPYGLAFMGHRWDYEVPGVDVWAECLRVLKPGGHLLSFFGTRTYHRGVVRVEDAGFEIRDMIAWIYGSGFPKSSLLHGRLEGWSPTLKPAQEPVLVARKPFKGTVAASVEQHGCGALNVDGCRVALSDEVLYPSCGVLGSTNHGWRRPWQDDPAAVQGMRARKDKAFEKANSLGRWPANLIHDGSQEVIDLMPKEAGAAAATYQRKSPKFRGIYGAFAGCVDENASGFHGDAGSAARFYYCAKASPAERAAGQDGKNPHPTVKPLALMRYLVRLVTPPRGTVLDPFLGSGTTLLAAALEGMDGIGVEIDEKYCEIAVKRVGTAEREAEKELLS